MMKLKLVWLPSLIFMLILYVSNACFVVHYVLYFEDIPMKYYLQISQNSSFPYIVHLNEAVNLPNNRTFMRQITPVQMSDIKKVETIYHNGGLYLDTDQFINYECVKKFVCNLSGLYFLDWTQKQRWVKSVPLSFIYASHPLNQTLIKSLEGLNQSAIGNDGPATVYFSGPSHMQQYRDEMSFIKLPKWCQYHRADRIWVKQKSYQEVSYQKQLQKQFLLKYNDEQKKAKKSFQKLWRTHTVIYPRDFNISAQHRVDDSFNHVEMIDKQKVLIKVVKYSKNEHFRALLQHFMRQMVEASKTISQNQTSTTQFQILNYKKKNSEQHYQNTSTIKQQLKDNKKNKYHDENQIKNVSLSKKQSTKYAKVQSQRQKMQYKQKWDPSLLQFIVNNFYLIFIIFFAVCVCFAIFIHKHTTCCRNNNQQPPQPDIYHPSHAQKEVEQSSTGMIKIQQIGAGMSEEVAAEEQYYLGQSNKYMFQIDLGIQLRKQSIDLTT